MTHTPPRRSRGAHAALAILAFTALLSACDGGDDDGPGSTPQAVATTTDDVSAALSMPPDGNAVATSADATAPADASGPTVIATDNGAAPSATANDAAAPSEPEPSAV